MGTVMIPGVGLAQEIVRRQPGKLVGKISTLQKDRPMDFLYPDSSSSCSLVKLGVPAANGVGPHQDIVAFSSICTHQGGPLQGSYKSEHKAIGPCPLHLTTFDPARRGIVVSGHATEPLPQILLEARGDEIFATGIIGLVFGKAANNLVR